MKICIAFITTFILVISGCMPKDQIKPAEEPISPDGVMQTIDSLYQTGFEFKIEFKNPNVSGTSKGISLNNKTQVNITRKLGTEKEKSALIGIDETEYSQVKGKWQADTRTFDTQPIELLKTICGQKDFKLTEEKNGIFIYSFTPNLLFMDPSSMDKPETTQGFIYIDNKTLMPVKVVAKTETASWSMTIKSTGKKLYIRSPKTKLWSLTIDTNKPKEVIRILTKRLNLYGVETLNSQTTDKSIIFQLYSENKIPEKLFQSGKTELYIAEYPKQSIYELSTSEEKDICFVNNDPTKPILLKNKLEAKLMDVELNFEGKSDGQTGIKLKFNTNLPETTKIAILCDKEVVGFVPQTWGKELEIKCSKETALNIKFPLPDSCLVAKVTQKSLK
ncbi:MAG: hypothetical protein PHE49_11625 [bacterium]|nr:hypothetical protein [bacterium]